jgi:hypothetical protein
MQEPRRHRPATAADFHRLADLAHERGLRVFELGANRWFCTSHSNPFALHTVTAYSCDCQGFLAHGRCSHHAALLSHLGWLPEVEPEFSVRTENLTPADCPDCCGCGLQDFGRYNLPCETCGGSGVRPSPHLHDAPAMPMVATVAA